MTSQHDAISILLTGRSYLYILLQHVFGNPPGRELLAAVTGEDTVQALGLMMEQDEFAPFRSLQGTLKQDMEADAEGLLDRLRDEYTYLLIGPNKLPAPPWESVYVTKERLIFQESTLAVRRAYQAYGLLPANYPHEADDHLAMELDFMAQLAARSGERFESGKTAELLKLLTDQKAFLEEHPLKWVGTFAEQIQQSRTQHFYPKMAVLAAQVLTADSVLLEDLLSTLENQEER